MKFEDYYKEFCEVFGHPLWMLPMMMIGTFFFIEVIHTRYHGDMNGDAHGYCGGVTCASTLHGFPGMPHPGATSGYMLDGVETSFAPSNQAYGLVPDLHVEWHYIDGPVAETGLGDFVDEERLTLVFFINNIMSSPTPYQRSNSYDLKIRSIIQQLRKDLIRLDVVCQDLEWGICQKEVNQIYNKQKSE